MNKATDSANPNRRECLKTMAGVGAALATSGVAVAAGASGKSAGSKFYKGGAFDAKAAKAAYFQMMERFGYPIPDVLLGHDIFLLPGQVLPEHHHLGGAEGYGPKMEAWQVRYGEVEFYGEFKRAGDETPIADLPEAQRPWGWGEDWFRSKFVVKRTAKSGKLYTLEDPESWHFQRAGAEGAIVTEYATYHNHVSFSKPGMEFDSSKAEG